MLRFFWAWAQPVIMSEHKIHKRIMEESKKSNYNWFASADELVDVCHKKGFDITYAVDIKCAILNCYTDFYLHGEVRERPGVFIAFNDLLEQYNKSKDECDEDIDCDKIKKSMCSFLDAYIKRITFWQCISNVSDSYYEADFEYRKNKIEELMDSNFVNFDILEKQIRKEYKTYIDEGISNGTITYKGVELPRWENEGYINLKDNNNVKKKELKR